MRLNMEILKSAVILANEHPSDKKKYYQRFSYKFSLCIRSRKKRLCQWIARKCSIKGDFNQNDSLSIP